MWKNILNLRNLGTVVAITLLTIIPGSCLATEFQTAMKFTDGAQKYQLSRVANNVTTVDATGVLHSVYWSGGVATRPQSPSFVYYRTWTLESGWTSAVIVDDSIAGGERLGGRHPRLLLGTDGQVEVFWHDYRHCTEVGNWIDNIEIYQDTKPMGGSFSITDKRLTDSSAPHLGDNSYTPCVALGPQGQTTLSWYDFNAEPDFSDIYLTTSGVGESLETLTDLASARLTFVSERGGGPAYTVPDLTVDPTGQAHLVWAGGQGEGVDLCYAALTADATRANEVVLTSNGTDFFDPAHITTAPDGSTWVIYGDDSSGGTEDLVVRHRPLAASQMGPAQIVVGGHGRQFFGDLEVDDLGILHLVWVDTRSGTHVYYGRFDPDSQTLLEEVRLTEQTGYYARPTLALDRQAEVYILWEEEFSLTAGDLWFTTSKTIEPSLVEGWSHYE